MNASTKRLLLAAIKRGGWITLKADPSVVGSLRALRDEGFIEAQRMATGMWMYRIAPPGRPVQDNTKGAGNGQQFSEHE